MSSTYKFDHERFKLFASNKGFKLKLVSNFGIFKVNLIDEDGFIISSGAGDCMQSAIAHCAAALDDRCSKENLLCETFCEKL